MAADGDDRVARAQARPRRARKSNGSGISVDGIDFNHPRASAAGMYAAGCDGGQHVDRELSRDCQHG